MNRTVLPVVGLAFISCVVATSFCTIAADEANKNEPRPGQFEYPNATTSRCDVKNNIHFNALMNSKDDFDKVTKYYQELTGVDLSAKEVGQVRMKYERTKGGDNWSMFVDIPWTTSCNAVPYECACFRKTTKNTI